MYPNFYPIRSRTPEKFATMKDCKLKCAQRGSFFKIKFFFIAKPISIGGRNCIIPSEKVAMVPILLENGTF